MIVLKPSFVWFPRIYYKVPLMYIYVNVEINDLLGNSQLKNNNN